MTVVFNMSAKSFLAQSISASAISLKITPVDYPRFLSGHAAGDHLHAVLLDDKHYEIVKVNITGSSQVTGLSVERGQQGSDARTWPAGTLIYQDITAADLENILQRAIFRSVAYNPNGVLVPAYAGEKVYQSDLQIWWKSVDAVNTEWRLIAGKFFVADPQLSPAADTYPNGQACTITYTTPGATIHYSLDGTDPDENSPVYTVPIVLPFDETTTVKAVAVHSDRWYTPSGIVEAEYITTFSCDMFDPEGVPAYGVETDIGLEIAGGTEYSQYVFPSDAGSSKGHIFAATYNGTFNHIYFQDGEWEAQTVPYLTGIGNQTVFRQVVIDSNGVFHIVGLGAGGLIHVYGAKGSWTAELIDAAPTTAEAAIAVDSSNKAHVAYVRASLTHGFNAEDVYYATNKTGSWVKEQIAEAQDVNDWRGFDGISIGVDGSTVYIAHSDRRIVESDLVFYLVLTSGSAGSFSDSIIFSDVDGGQSYPYTERPFLSMGNGSYQLFYIKRTGIATSDIIVYNGSTHTTIISGAAHILSAWGFEMSTGDKILVVNEYKFLKYHTKLYADPGTGYAFVTGLINESIDDNPATVLVGICPDINCSLLLGYGYVAASAYLNYRRLYVG